MIQWMNIIFPVLIVSTIYLITRVFPAFAPKVKVTTIYEGKWAVVTGATSGVGREVAKGLAALGLNLVLVGRSNERLETISNQLIKEYKVYVVTVKADFAAHPSMDRNIAKAHECLKKVFARTSPSVLSINHDVGKLSVFGQCFISPTQNPKKIIEEECLHLNTMLLIDNFVNTNPLWPKRKRLITIMSSANEYFPSAFIGTYHARKALLSGMGRAVYVDNDNIDVTIVVPGLIENTNFFTEALTEFNDMTQGPEEKRVFDLSKIKSSEFACSSVNLAGGLKCQSVSKLVTHVPAFKILRGYRSIFYGFDCNIIAILRGLSLPGRTAITALFTGIEWILTKRNG